MSQKSVQELQQMIERLQQQLRELGDAASRNVNRIDLESLPVLRGELDKVTKRVTHIEKYLRNVQKMLARNGMSVPTL